MANRLLTAAAALLAGAAMVGSGVVGVATAPPSVVADARAPIVSTSAVSVARSTPAAKATIRPTLPPLSPSPVASAVPPGPVGASAGMPPTALTVTPPPVLAAATPTVQPSPQPAPTVPTAAASGPAPVAPSAITPLAAHSVRGVVIAVQGARVIVRPPTGGQVQVETNVETLLTEDRRRATMAAVRPGCAVVVVGAPNAAGALVAHAMLVSPPPPQSRGPDRPSGGGRR